MNERSFKNVRDKIVLITGASSGIGAAIAREAARRGARVVLIARREAELARVTAEIRAAGGRAEWISGDLSAPAERNRLLEEIRNRYARVDVLVSNAGGGWYGRLWEMEWDSVERLIELNAVATVRLAHDLLPQMVAEGSGHLIAMSSIAGSLPAQGIAVYSATKAFVDAFCRSVFRETRRTGVSVSAVKPGAVRTAFFDKAEEKGGRRVPLSGGGVSELRVARRVVGLMRWPRKTIFIPFYFRLIPLVETLFGWALDLLGPVHLNRRTRPALNATRRSDRANTRRAARRPSVDVNAARVAAKPGGLPQST